MTDDNLSASLPELMEEGERFTFHAAYEDAEDVRGTVTATGVTAALDAAADDLLRQVGKDPIAYGKLVKVTVESEDGITMTVRPEYDVDV